MLWIKLEILLRKVYQQFHWAIILSPNQCTWKRYFPSSSSSASYVNLMLLVALDWLRCCVRLSTCPLLMVSKIFYVYRFQNWGTHVKGNLKRFSVFRSDIRESCKKFCHWVRITSVLRFIQHIFITNIQSIPPLLKHIFVTFLSSCEKQKNSLLLVSVGDTDK